MSASTLSSKRFVRPPSCAGSFRAHVNQQPLKVDSLVARLTLRPELSDAPSHWIWKIIAEGKVGPKRTSIGLFFDRDLRPGIHDLVSSELIRVVYNESPHWNSVIYHSEHLQTGRFILIEADLQNQRLRGEFSFGMSAVDFEVTDGTFDVQCS